MDPNIDPAGWCENVEDWPLPGWRVSKSTRENGVAPGRADYVFYSAPVGLRGTSQKVGLMLRRSTVIDMQKISDAISQLQSVLVATPSS